MWPGVVHIPVQETEWPVVCHSSMNQMFQLTEPYEIQSDHPWISPTALQWTRIPATVTISSSTIVVLFGFRPTPFTGSAIWDCQKLIRYPAISNTAN